jgi:phenylacetate-CoA ligase
VRAAGYALRGVGRRLLRQSGPDFRRSLARLRESERWPRARLEEAAWRAAEAQAAHALARSPFYRAVGRRIGLAAGESVGREAWSLLPLTTKDDLHADRSAFLTRPAWTCARAFTSGTTGTPRTVYRDLGSIVVEHALYWRQWGWFGVTPRDRRATLRARLFPADHQGPVFWRPNPAERQLALSSYHLGPRTFERYWSAILRYRPTVLEGYPSLLNGLAVLMEAHGVDPYPVRAVITSSEAFTEAVERRIAAAFPGPLADRYGQVERVCSFGRCEQGRMHVFPEDGLVELLPLPEAADGRCEIVGTSLHNRAFPLLRYRTGDVVRPLEETCPCGREFPVTGPVEGRVSDPVVTSDGRWVWPQRMVVVDGVAECQIVQWQPGEVTCYLLPDARFTADTPAALAEAIRRDLGPREIVRVEVVDRLDRTAHGKFQRIRSYVPLEAVARERRPG